MGGSIGLDAANSVAAVRRPNNENARRAYTHRRGGGNAAPVAPSGAHLRRVVAHRRPGEVHDAAGGSPRAISTNASTDSVGSSLAAPSARSSAATPRYSSMWIGEA